MLTLSSWKNIGGCLLLCVAAAISSSAQTLTTLHTFDLTDGAFPFGTLVQGLDGNLYGTTAQGNGRNQCAGGCGTVFKITPQGTLTTLHNFKKTDGHTLSRGWCWARMGTFTGAPSGMIAHSRAVYLCLASSSRLLLRDSNELGRQHSFAVSIDAKCD